MALSLSNKKLIVSLIIAVTAVIVGFAGMLLFGNKEAMAADSTTEATGGTGETEGKAVEVKALVIDDAEKYAARVYECRVEDTSDTASVAGLLDAMNIEKVTGRYTVKIGESDGQKTLTLSVANGVRKGDREQFDSNMTAYAEQLLALMPELERVVWNYQLLAADGNNDNISESIDEAGVKKKSGIDVKKSGESEEEFLKMLENSRQGVSKLSNFVG